MFDRIENIFIDYENGIFLVNGKKPECLVKLSIKEADGWNISKLMNYEKVENPTELPVIADVVIDATKITEAEILEKFRKIVHTEIYCATQTQNKNSSAPVRDEY